LNKQKTILVFGGGVLQTSIIQKIKNRNIRCVVIDPNAKAPGRNIADVFETVDGNDFPGTCTVIEKYNVNGIITAATDKPLVMMAKVASKYDLPFFSERTAAITTDKWLMKKQFEESNIPHAKGYKVNNTGDIKDYPVIIKPVDNSGSRGVGLCRSSKEASKLINEAITHTRKDFILVEEYIEGQEYSVEAIHTHVQTDILQVTEKQLSKFPSRVEMGHMAPAELDPDTLNAIESVIKKIAKSFNYKACASHTEIKINNGKITVIETSPRLGGDMITSHLVPLSTGQDIEDFLIDICLDSKPILANRKRDFAGIFYINLPLGTVTGIHDLSAIRKHPNCISLEVTVKVGDEIREIKNSLDRYGHVVVQANDLEQLNLLRDEFLSRIVRNIEVNANSKGK
jgi:biotin carboxylase